MPIRSSPLMRPLIGATPVSTPGVAVSKRSSRLLSVSAYAMAASARGATANVAQHDGGNR